MPATGEIALLAEPFTAAAGAGAVCAVALARAGAAVTLLTALGNDGAADEAERFLVVEGIDVRAARREQAQTGALTVIGADGERTIMVVGANLHPEIGDDLGWDDLAGFDAVYFTGHDPATLVAARAAPRLVTTARRLGSLEASGVRADVLVGSAVDPGETVPGDAVGRLADAVVETLGAGGGSWRRADGASGRWRALDPGAPLRDTYGAGDSFQAGLTLGLAQGHELPAAILLGARLGAAAVTRRGPYG